jgi:tripartite ATP-independent transporter DctP family solute receptor
MNQKPVKMMMLAAILVFAAVPVFAGGSGESGGGEKKQLVVVFGSHLNPGSPENLAMLWMADELAKQSNGVFKGEVYEGGSIGNEADLVEQVQSGQTQLAIGGSAPQDRYVRKYTVTTIPFMLEDANVLDAVFSGKIGDAMRKIFSDNNILIPGYSLRGNRQLTANRHITSPKDLTGMKLRLPENKVWMDVWKELGTLPTPVASPEVFSALQTGVVESQENPISSNYQKALWEVQKYTIMTNHLFDYFLWESSKNWCESLDPQLRKIFDDVVAAGIQKSTDITSEMEANYRADMEKRGMTYVDNVDFRAFREKALPAIERATQDLEPWVYEELKNILAKLQ